MAFEDPDPCCTSSLSAQGASETIGGEPGKASALDTSDDLCLGKTARFSPDIRIIIEDESSSSPAEEKSVPRRKPDSLKPAVQHSNLASNPTTIECLEAEMIATPSRSPVPEPCTHLEHQSSLDNFELPKAMSEDCPAFACSMVKEEEEGDFDRTLLMTMTQKQGLLPVTSSIAEGGGTVEDGLSGDEVVRPEEESALTIRVREARTRLQEAIKRGELKGVLAAMRECEGAGMPEAELKAAKQELFSAAKDAAEEESVSELELRKAQAREALQEAFKTGVVDMLRSALQAGSLAGLEPKELFDANERLSAATLRQAVGLGAVTRPEDTSLSGIGSNRDLAFIEKAHDQVSSENLSDGMHKLVLRSTGVAKASERFVEIQEKAEKIEQSQEVAAHAIENAFASLIPQPAKKEDALNPEAGWRSNSERSVGWLSRAAATGSTLVSSNDGAQRASGSSGRTADHNSVRHQDVLLLDLKTVDPNHLPPLRRISSAPGEIRDLSIPLHLQLAPSHLSSVAAEINQLKAQLENERSERQKLNLAVSDVRKQLRACQPPVSPSRVVYMSPPCSIRRSRRKLASSGPVHSRSSPSLQNHSLNQAPSKGSTMAPALRSSASRQPGSGGSTEMGFILPPVLDQTPPLVPLETLGTVIDHARTVVLEKRLLSERRVQKMMELDKEGRDTWQLRRAEKVQRLKEKDVFPNKMWGTFFRWQGDGS